jgi:hypothetical protein
VLEKERLNNPVVGATDVHRKFVPMICNGNSQGVPERLMKNSAESRYNDKETMRERERERWEHYIFHILLQYQLVLQTVVSNHPCE